MNTDIVKEVDALDVFDKARVWNHYMVKIHSLRTRPFFVITTMYENYQTPGDWIMRSRPRKEAIPTRTIYPGENTPLIPIEDFFNPSKCIAVFDNGHNWKERGYAERMRTQYRGAYDWYWRFKDRIFA